LDFINKVAIIGVGMLGGSIGLSLKKLFPNIDVVGFGRDRSKLDKAVKINAIDKYFLSYESTIKSCDIIIICTPVKLIHGIFAEIRPFLKEGCVVTDVGSTKFEVVDSIYREFGVKANFVGSHPMAGSEKTGVDSAICDLYKDTLVIITEDDHTNKEAVNKVNLFWKALGAKTIKLSPSYHDKVVGETSHLTHLVASSLAYTLSDSLSDSDIKKKIFGNGLLDTTRIAEGDPQMWLDIFISNRENIIKAVNRFQDNLHDFANLLINNDKHKIMDYLLKGKKFRERLVSLSNLF
jgi:prephenate dehydrogenase